MALPDTFIQDLKLRNDIVDVISSYVNLKKTGRNLVGLCPFHNEKTPSFSVSRENGFFYCFGCGAGGDVITFIKRMENLDYIDAVRFLAKRSGLEMPEDSKNVGITQIRSRIYEANREAARFYYRQLYGAQGKDGLAYLRNRGLTEKTITHFGLGFAPARGFELVDYLKSKGFSESDLILANLAIKSRKGRIYDRFFNRVIFPIIDIRGNVIAFGGRIMTDEKPKYLNTSDTPAFNKSTNLFALQFAKNAANGVLILAEGYMDVIALHQAGFENTVATLGTALTQEQAIIIKRYCKEVIICYDADEAGQKATARAISILKPTGLNIRVITIPNGKDPDEFMRNYGTQGPDRFRQLIEKSANDTDYRLTKLKAQYNLQNADELVSYLTECAKIIAALENSIEQDVYISKLCMEYNTDKFAFKRQVSKFSRQNQREQSRHEQQRQQMELSARGDRINTEKADNLRAANAEEALIASVIYNPDFVDTIFSEETEELFSTTFNKAVFHCIYSRLKSGLGATLSDISSEFSNDEISRIAQIMAHHPPDPAPEQTANEYLSILKDEKQKIKPSQAANLGDDEILQYVQNMKTKKQ